MAKGFMAHTGNYIPACSLRSKYPGIRLSLVIRQQPIQARISTNNERDRKPIEPPPIIQIQLERASPQEKQDFLQDPYLLMYVNLVNPISEHEVSRHTHQVLSGQIVSSMYKLKDVTDKDDGFFCFGDMSCRMEGEYRLKFSLFEIVADGAINLMHIFSNVFRVYSSKTMPKLLDATFLSRSFSDQGVRIRIRKEHRVQSKRKLSARSDDHKEDDDGDSITTSPPQRHCSDTSTRYSSFTRSSSPESNINYTPYYHQQQFKPYLTRGADMVYQDSSFKVQPHSPPLQYYELNSRQNSISQQQPIHPYQKTGQQHQTAVKPASSSARLDQQRKTSMENKGILPLSPRPSISTTYSGQPSHWISTAPVHQGSFSDTSIYTQYPSQEESQSTNPIRLPPLHTLVSSGGDSSKNESTRHKADDVGQVNAAVAIMQLSRHQNPNLTHPLSQQQQDDSSGHVSSAGSE